MFIKHGCLIIDCKQNVLAGDSLSCFLLLSSLTELWQSRLVTRHKTLDTPSVLIFFTIIIMPGLWCLRHTSEIKETNPALVKSDSHNKAPGRIHDPLFSNQNIVFVTLWGKRTQATHF